MEGDKQRIVSLIHRPMADVILRAQVQSERKTLWSLAISHVAKLSGLLAGFLLFPYAAHKLGPGVYGPWLVMTSATMFAMQADLGFGATLVKKVAEVRARHDLRTQNEICSSTFALFAVTGLVLSAGFMLVMRASLPHMQIAVSDQETFGVLAWFVGFFGVGIPIALRPFVSIMLGAQRFKLDGLFMLLAAAFRTIGVVLALHLGGGILAVALIELMAFALPGLLAAFYVLTRLKDVQIKRRYASWKSLRPMVPSSLQLFAMSSLGLLILHADNLIVSVVVSAAAVTVYAAGFRLYQAVRAVVSLLLDPFLARSSSLHALEGKGSLSALLVALTKGAFTITCLAGVPAIICARPALQAWAGEEYTVAAPVVTILIVSFLVNVLHVPAFVLLTGVGQPGRFLPLHVAWCVSNLVLSVLLGRQFGITGVALATAIPVVVLEPCYIVRACRTFGIDAMTFVRESIARPGAAAAMGVVVSVAFGRAAGLGADMTGRMGVAIVFAVAFLIATVLLEGPRIKATLRVALREPIASASLDSAEVYP